MRKIRSTKDIQSLGTILGVWAHPDDETFTMGCIAAAAVRNGQLVVCVTATRGEAGVQDPSRWPSHKLASIRTKELQKALKIIGVKHHYWLDYKDGCCHQISQKIAARRIADLIELHQPNTVLTFGPEGLTGHSDHQTVSHWTSLAIKMSRHPTNLYHVVQAEEQFDHLIEVDKKFNIFFNIEKPPLTSLNQCDICYCGNQTLVNIKLRSLAAMPSQTEALLSAFNKDQLKKSFGIETFVKASYSSKD